MKPYINPLRQEKKKVMRQLSITGKAYRRLLKKSRKQYANKWIESQSKLIFKHTGETK